MSFAVIFKLSAHHIVDRTCHSLTPSQEQREARFMPPAWPQDEDASSSLGPVIKCKVSPFLCPSFLACVHPLFTHLHTHKHSLMSVFVRVCARAGTPKSSVAGTSKGRKLQEPGRPHPALSLPLGVLSLGNLSHLPTAGESGATFPPRRASLLSFLLLWPLLSGFHL